MVIDTYDIIDFENFPKPQSVEKDAKTRNASNIVNCYYPKVGKIQFKSDLFPHMHLMNMHWYTEDEVTLWDKVSSDNININFHLAGNLDTRFYGIQDELNMRPGRHNLIYSPEGGFVNRTQSKSSLEMFHLSLDKSFFLNAIGSDDAWSEEISGKLARGESFSGIAGTADITPAMLNLIREIKEADSRGPLRNLLVQSRILELLALQIGQFRVPVASSEIFRADEMEKLYQLKDFLDANFLRELTLSQLSRVCLLNEFKVKKGFKALFGLTVFGYLRKLRMEYAKKLLLDSALTVEEVSGRLGYEHAHHFSAAFKNFTGTSPSQFKSKITTYSLA
ncbi:helix-turn-helix domain-containing protein [Dyadobacter aurulentus]|uniref:helix-turn-helix domain-containing protein n=1 Tax=Dyadobacter sp. UC 10 TaxID=2605428 RepID=UPI0011F2D74B|nr:AraC family transcriptional regulator [Dyadobacter sp. UC 10]KAA0993116.1 helix-turn-helix transcriptional regulator [Dyadobacter sp. UC 10]